MIAYVKKVAQQLAPLYTDKIQREQIVWWMLEAITGKKEAELIALKEPSAKAVDLLQEWITKHVKQKMPLQYLIGSVPFIDITIAVEPPVLIPRPETEEWVANLITQMQTLADKNITIFDLCTGSGVIALALAHAFKQAVAIGTDIADHALSVAQENKSNLKIPNVSFVKSDLFAALTGKKADLIIANPPYINEADWQQLDPMVREWEDKDALVASNNGLALIEEIIRQAPAFLYNNTDFSKHQMGQLYIEIDYNQGSTVLNFMKRYFTHADILKDYNGQDRVAVGYLS